MSQSRRQGNTLLISLGVFTLFALSNLMTDPALGTTEALNDATTPVTVSTTATAAVSADRYGEYRLEAAPIKPRRSRIGSLTTSANNDGYFNHCLIDFNDDSIIAQLPHQATTTEVEWPYWNQYCPSPDIAVAVHPVGTSHYHLGYVDKTLMWCFDLGTFGRPVDPDNLGAGCDPIDPLSEPRSGVQPHLINYSIRIFAYDINTKERIKLDLNQIRILSGQAEICFVKTDLPWIAAEPTDQPPGYCGDLGAGNWDVSASVVNVHEVRIYARSTNMSFTDLGIRTN